MARRAIVPLVVLAVIAGAGALGWERLSGEILKQEVVTTEVALISPSQAEVQVTASGYVIPQRTSKVGSKLPGRLAKVFVALARAARSATRASTTSSPARRPCARAWRA